KTNVKQAMLSNTRTFSPSLVNEFRFGATKFYNNLAQELQYQRDIHKEFGLGLFDPPPIAWGLPSFSISGFSGFGAGAAVPFTGNNKIFQWIDNVTWIRGSHSMKFGAELRRDHYNMIGTQEIRGSSIIDSRATCQAYFFQDAWRAGAKLSLALGLRYEYTPPWTDLQQEQMNMWIPPDFLATSSLPGSQAGKPCFVRVGSGDPYQAVSTRFDPA